MLSGPYDEAYLRETAKIGRDARRVGLPQRYMFTAMALIRVALERIAEETLGAGAAADARGDRRLLDLELAIMLETYRDDFVAADPARRARGAAWPSIARSRAPSTAT